jgi:enoyl-CoA hydratase
MVESLNQELDTLSVRLQDTVATVSIDKQESMNAIDFRVLEELEDAMDWASSNDDVNVIVITGRGEHFSAGGNIDWLAERAEERPLESWRSAVMACTSYGTSVTTATLDCVKPIVTKVRGNAIGVGGTLATLGDIVVVEEEARLGDPHVLLGLVPPNSVGLWPTLTSANKAKELLMRGETISGSEAADIGLANHAVPAEQLDETVEDIVDDLATGPQHAIRFTKRTVTRIQQRSMMNVRPEAHTLEALAAQSEDHRAALEALQEDKHAPIRYPSGRGPDGATDAED